MQIEFYKDDGVTISHFHLIAETAEEQTMIDQLQGHFMLCREASQPNLVGLRRLVYSHAAGEAHGLIYQGWMDK